MCFGEEMVSPTGLQVVVKRIISLKSFLEVGLHVLDSGLSPAMITMIVLQKLLWQANTVHPLLL